MPWVYRHSRFRAQLSAYVDGELSAASRERLEGHLGGCDACRAELDELRATVAALGEMPAPSAARSFTLTPEQAAAPRPSLLAARPLDFGMRIAAAGVAVALAAVVVVDAGGLGDSGGDQAQRTTTEMQQDVDTTPTAAYGDYGSQEPDAAGTPNDLDAPVSSDDDQADGEEPPSGGVGAEPAGSPTVEPAGGGTGLDAGHAALTPVPVDKTADQTPEPGVARADEDDTTAEAAAPPRPSSDDDGIGALTAAEIALAAALAALLAGSAGLAYARRRR